MSSSILSSNLTEQRWVDQISKHFSIDIDPKPCVFRVPKTLIQQKPEAYTPQNPRLGPYHHFFMSDLYDAQKIEALKKYLSGDHFTSFKALVVDKLKEIEPSIRACYDQFLDLDSETLVWILAIDGTYLLHLLSSYSNSKEVTPENNGSFALDMVMLENQIPFLVLKTINESLGYSSDKLLSEFSAFARAHSPLPVDNNAVDVTSKHLLDSINNLILQFVHRPDLPSTKLPLPGIALAAVELLDSPEAMGLVPSLPTTEAAVTALEALAGLLRGTPVQKPVTFLASLPWQMCLGNLNTTEQPSLDEIKVPSVTQLHEIAKLNFELIPAGLRCLSFDKDKRILYLPKIILNADSEVILRNLIAYEEAKGISAGTNYEIADYIDLLSGIIDTEEDVMLLKKSHIIESELGNEEIAEMFNCMIKSTRMKSCLEEITRKLNELYDNTEKIKIWRFIKKHIVPSKTSMKVWGVIFQILVVFLLSFGAYCDVFSCRFH